MMMLLQNNFAHRLLHLSKIGWSDSGEENRKAISILNST